MTVHHADTRKIDPSRQRPDGTPADPDRVEIGPTELAFAEWEAAGLEAPHLPTMRQYRLDRLVSEMARRDLAGLFLTDPLNIRYATDTTNMQIWNMHNPFRAVLVLADGYMVVWDYKTAPFLSSFNPLVREARTSASLFYFEVGDRGHEAADALAGEVDALLRAHAGSNRRLAVDKLMLHGVRAFEAVGLSLLDGEEVAEKARAIKGPDEVRAMRCALHTCEAAMAEMERGTLPGMSEVEIWAMLHAGNIKRGGEWIETRLLATGPRTSPWFQECGPRRLRPNEILAFDTDLVGPYGLCADISRTWWIGDKPPRPDMISDFRMSVDHIEENMALLRPGVSFRELTEAGHHLPPAYQRQKYGCKFHGVGLCDEWPMIPYPDGWRPGALDDYVVEPGMCFCVEVLTSREGGDFSIKLEEQVVVTETGVENLTRYPWDARLMGMA
ncbi:MAG: dimethylsulfonioproprionate lyase DddP [Pseudomonadota bacterium]